MIRKRMDEAERTLRAQIGPDDFIRQFRDDDDEDSGHLRVYRDGIEIYEIPIKKGQQVGPATRINS